MRWRCARIWSVADPLNVGWLGLRGRAHRAFADQCTSNFVPVRFTVFAVASLLLMIITVRNVLALF